MPQNPFEWSTAGSTGGTGDPNPTGNTDWQQGLFADTSIDPDSPVGSEIQDLLVDLGLDEDKASEMMTYLDEYDPTRERFASMKQELDLFGAESAYGTAMDTLDLKGEQAEFGMRGQMGAAQAGARGKLSEVLQAGRKVGGFGGRQRAIESGKQDIFAQTDTAMETAKQQRDFALDQINIGRKTAEDAYTSAVGAADLSYQEDVYSAREDWQDDIFSMITNIVQMVNA